MAKLTEVFDGGDLDERVRRYTDFGELVKSIEEEIGEVAISYEKELFDLKKKNALAEAKKIEARLKKQKDWDKKTASEKKKAIDDELALQMEAIEKRSKKELELQEKLMKVKKADVSSLGKLTASFAENFSVNGGGFKGVLAGMSGITGALDSQIESIAKLKSTVDTRLQGSNKTRNWDSFGSYWDRINNNITSLSTAAIGLVSQESLSNNVVSMIKSGISYNVEQRAFLNTVKDKIADTFDANNGTLLKLVRIQQQDSTAARLGMESVMTTFLNNMYDNTEYMNSVMQDVKSTLQEAESLMTTSGAVEFEYQVQKWMGSLYSVGFSSSSSIASALNQLASGDISGLTGSGVGNLMITAANRAGLSLSSILANGLDAETTNSLMSAMVSYLQQIAGDTKDSKLLQQQYANVYGLKASDLKAAANLSESMKDILGSNMSYSDAEKQLTSMLGTAYNRTSVGELTSNAWSNAMYSMSASIGSNPVLYWIYKVGNLLEDVAGGLTTAGALVAGTGVAGTFNLAQIMKAGALSGGILSSLGSVIGAASDVNAFSGWDKILGLGTTNTVKRGTAAGNVMTSGLTTSASSSTYVGNSNGNDAYNAMIAGTQDETAQKVSAAKEESDEVPMSQVDEHVVAIYDLLSKVVNGSSSFKVSMDNYGLVTNSAGF